MKPISPQEIEDTLEEIFPDAVIMAVNELLKERYRPGNSVNLKQDEIINRIQHLDSSLSRTELFNKHYLDFESLFQKAGWKVSYDKPGYNENYAANFTFEKQKIKE